MTNFLKNRACLSCFLRKQFWRLLNGNQNTVFFTRTRGSATKWNKDERPAQKKQMLGPNTKLLQLYTFTVQTSCKFQKGNSGVNRTTSEAISMRKSEERHFNTLTFMHSITYAIKFPDALSCTDAGVRWAPPGVNWLSISVTDTIPA